MRPILPALVTSVITSLLLSGTAAGATVRGNVRDSANAARLEGTVVAAYDGTGALRASATSDATGFYQLSLGSGSYRLLAYDMAGVYATAFDSGAESFETSPLRALAASTVLELDFALQRGGTIRGSVRTAGGTPLRDMTAAVYNLSGTRRGFAVTNLSGEYEAVVPPGQYKVVVFDESGTYATVFHDGVRTFTEAAPLTVAAAQSTRADFRTGRAGRLTGTVSAEGRGLAAGMDVYVYTVEGAFVTKVATDAAGAFVLRLYEGTYRIAAADPAKEFATAYLGDARSFDTSSIVTIQFAQTASPLSILLVRGGRIGGRVLDPAGAPIVTASVAAYNIDGTQRASTAVAADGSFELVVPSGQFKLAAFDLSLVWATEFYTDARKFDDADVLTVVQDTAVTGLTLTPERAGRVSGIVTDMATALPIAGIVVAVYDATDTLVASVQTAADGRYALAVAPASYRVLAFDPQIRYVTAYDSGAATFETTPPRNIVADTGCTSNFALRRGIRVPGTAFDAAGGAVSGVTVFALDAAGNRVAGGEAHDGAFTIVLLPGTYRFAAIDPARRYRTEYYGDGAAVTIENGQPAPTIAFVLTPASRRRAARH